MEMTDDMLRSIANNIADLRTQLLAVQTFVVDRLSEGDPQELDRLMEETRESPDYQSMCDNIFEQLKRG